VRALAEGKDAAATMLAHAMTPNPITIAANSLAIDALRRMNDGGFRHLPVVKDDTILGVVSRADFKGIEIDQLDDEEHLWECIR
jgi:CBS domain-containing protein